MNRLKTRIGIIALAWLLMVGSAGAATIAPAVEEAMQHGGDIAFIVQFRDRLDLQSLPGRAGERGLPLAELIPALHRQADNAQQAARSLLLANGARRMVQLWAINALAVTANAQAIRALAALPEVESITLDATLAAPSPQPAATVVPEWNIDAVGAATLWSQGLTGLGTVVAGVDTGVDAFHADLTTRWRGGANSWYDPNGEHATPYDASGHGTQSLSVAVGGDAGGSAIGVAPDAQWIAVKIFNDAGIASLSGIHLGFQWLLDPDSNPLTADNPDVVNSSWGFPSVAGQCYLEFETDLEVLKAAGIAVVFSAGNEGSGGSVSPADNPAGFGVGAVDSSLSVASFSSRGPSACDGSFFPEVVAPGVAIRTADLTAGGLFPDSYTSVSGTSFAAPHVAGAMALLRQAYPTATPAQLEEAVTTGATDIAAVGPDNDSGYGLLNAVGANDWLANASLPPPCTDFDADGFFAEANCGTQIDCNDLDASINPLACDIKGDGIDQDCDGVDRLTGKSCPVAGGGSGGGGSGGGGKGKKK